ncbi:DUF2142 domain-containing protein [Actinomyces marmotae]|uniref:DUF2142 domain-containing protein n=1 Tax=Actinomyces marmotae TaxID=2737173 RepID=A0A6M8AZ78_9ACTO|nr:DUF2142 domain-containing protein [Actinomyces marmotae]QKD79178.1 DUF2142 domain-containing protein [Actinomyces marmotae]
MSHDTMRDHEDPPPAAAAAARSGEAPGLPDSPERGDSPAAAPSSRRAAWLDRPATRWILGALLALTVLVTGLGWALASPVGGSPDDDYHLGAIWCPPPVESSGCATKVINNEVQVYVPETVSQRTSCFSYPDGDGTMRCKEALSDDEYTYSRRYDAGNYPGGYYWFHHQFVSADVTGSVLIMRGVNLLIAMVLLGSIGFLLPARYRESLALTILVAWMPMGLYFVASNNPTSWALSGTLGYAAALFGALRAEGRRRWALLGLAAVGALLACSARGDSAFFILVISLAVLVGAPWTRRILPEAALALTASAIGVWIMRSTGQASALESTSSSGETDLSMERLHSLLTSLPEYFAGFYGQRWGAGWFDIPLDGAPASIAIGLAAICLFAGARRVGRRKALSILIVIGAIAGVPLVVSLQAGFSRVYQYQPRYMLPLLAILLFVWLAMSVKGRHVVGVQVWLIGIGSVLVNAFALRRVMERYTHGRLDLDHPIYSLDLFLRWWWPDFPLTPEYTWRALVLVYAVAIASLSILVWGRPARAITGPTAPSAAGQAEPERQEPAEDFVSRSSPGRHARIQAGQREVTAPESPDAPGTPDAPDAPGAPGAAESATRPIDPASRPPALPVDGPTDSSAEESHER